MGTHIIICILIYLIFINVLEFFNWQAIIFKHSMSYSKHIPTMNNEYAGIILPLFLDPEWSNSNVCTGLAMAACRYVCFKKKIIIVNS